jgi:hypothetical protein
MQQVLETPDIQGETAFIAVEERPIPSPERAAATTENTRQPIITLLRSIRSVFTGSRPEYIPKEYRAIVERHDTPIDHLCRIDPGLCIRSLSV